MADIMKKNKIKSKVKMRPRHDKNSEIDDKENITIDEDDDIEMPTVQVAFSQSLSQQSQKSSKKHTSQEEKSQEKKKTK